LGQEPPGKKRRAKKRGRKSTRAAKLVDGYLERKPRKLLESQFEEIEGVLPYQRGVYALYDHGELYYVGIARTRLAGRVRHHTRDKHSKKWNAFSIYACKSTQAIEALEQLFLRIARPSGNSQIRSLRSPDLTRKLHQRARELRKLLKSQLH